MKILALDISSATIGWALMENIDSVPNLIKYGHIKPISKKKSDDNISLRLFNVEEKINKLLLTEKPDVIVIEDYVKKFSKGKSSANTIIILAVFNETTALLGYKFTKKKAVRYTVTQLRSFVQKKFGVSIKDKDEVINFISGYFKNYKTVTNKVGNVKKECEDEADAIILGLYHLLQK